MKKFDWDFIEQLSLGLDVEEVETEESSLSREEVLRRSEQARRALEQGEHWGEDAPEWMRHYIKLGEMGYPWRVAVYIAWAASPRQERWPETKEDLATQVLGLKSARQIYKWRKKYEGIDQAITMMQAAPLLEHRADIYDALVKVASDPDYKANPDRKLALEMLGDYTPRAKIGRDFETMSDDLSELSERELDTLSRALGIEMVDLLEDGEA
jgi:hypothetical protein